MGLCQVLGNGASCMDLLLGREDVAGKEFVSFLILTFIFHFCFVLLHLYFYSGMGKWASMTGSDPMGFRVVGLSFGPHLLMTGRANTGAL